MLNRRIHLVALAGLLAVLFAAAHLEASRSGASASRTRSQDQCSLPLHDLLAGSHTSSGTEVSGNFDIRARASLSAGTHWKPWGTGYYHSYDRSHLNHANVVEISWNYGSYPGYWYAFQKSAIADDPNNNNVYGFNSASYRFANSAVGGHRS